MRILRIVAGLCLALASVLLMLPAQAQSRQLDLNGPGAVTVIAQVNTATGPRLLDGIVFTISRIDGVDPTTAQGRALVEQYQQNPALAKDRLVDTVTLDPTDARGRTTIYGLPVAAYLIHQQGSSTPMEEPAGASERVRDFVLSMPTNGPDGKPVYTLDITPKPTVVLPPTEPSTSPQPCVTPSAGTTARPVVCPEGGSEGGTEVLPPAPGASPNGPGEGTAVAGPQSGLQINAGDGANFNIADQIALIGLGVAVLILALLAGRRRRRERGDTVEA